MLPLALAVSAGSFANPQKKQEEMKLKQLAWGPAGFPVGEGRGLLAQWAGSSSGPQAQCGNRDVPSSLLCFPPPCPQACGPHPTGAQGKTGASDVLQVMLSLPGSRRSLNVCMLMTASVLTIMGGCGLCLTRRWQVRAKRISSATVLQKERCSGSEMERVDG